MVVEGSKHVTEACSAFMGATWSDSVAIATVTDQACFSGTFQTTQIDTWAGQLTLASRLTTNEVITYVPLTRMTVRSITAALSASYAGLTILNLSHQRTPY